jgi:hypothetical protein
MTEKPEGEAEMGKEGPTPPGRAYWTPSNKGS